MSRRERSQYWQLIPYIRRHWRIIAQALLCTLVFTVFWPFLAWIAGEMLGALAAGEVGRLARLAGITTLLFLVQKLAQYGQDALMAQAALRAAFDLRVDTYAHLQTLSLSYFEAAKTGD
ncbi:MAG: ABC transporter transmembrane domain-containing protein, partial [Cyanobacteria bacterium P01_A01_bin.135]